jgi:hypothetical protein
MNEKELLSQLAKLPREIRPERDPWPDIDRRIEHPGARRTGNSAPGWLFKAAAASVFLVFAEGLLFKPLWNSGTGSFDQAPAIVSTAPIARSGPPAPPGMLATMEAEYLAAFREFVNVGGANENLAAQTIEKIEMGWADLRLTETALVTALEENPGDLFLNGRMLELRARQLGFLKQLATLDQNNRRMTI